MPAIGAMGAMKMAALLLALAAAACGDDRPRNDTIGDETATLTLAARCDDGADDASSLEVELSAALDGTPVYTLDDSVYGSSGMADLIENASAADDAGALPLIREVSGDPRVLHLRATRIAVGRTTLRYRARSVATPEPGARHGLRHDATGLGGLGAFFLVLPESDRITRVRVAWGPQACPPRPDRGPAVILSSFGAGPGPIDAHGDLASLRMASYFSGRPRVVSHGEGSTRFTSAWFGDPALDVTAAAEWASRVHAAERAFFADEPEPYHVFVRVLPSMGERSNGMGQPRSCLVAIGPETPFGPRLRINLAHEMLHRWLGLGLRLSGPEGSNFWFTEGFTVHYTATILLRAGLITSDEFLAELDTIATRHFANPRRGAGNDEIQRDFFTDDALSIVPYTRGALYAVEVDAAIRRASAGARSLDDVVRELFRAASTAPHHELPPASFRDTILRELGPEGAARFDAVVLRGADPDPPADAYGPCFRRVPHSITRADSTVVRSAFRWVRVAEVPDGRCDDR